MNKFIDSLKRPFSDFKILGIGFLFYVFVMLRFPSMNAAVSVLLFFLVFACLLILSGYKLECAHTSIKKKDKLPLWNDWGNRLLRGLIAFCIGLIYFLPVIIFLFVIIWKLIPFIMPNTTVDNLVVILVNNFTLELIFLAMLLIITMYVMPIALVSYAKNYSFKEAFNLKRMSLKIFSLKYLGSWLFIAAFWIILLFISGSFSLLFMKLSFSQVMVESLLGVINAFFYIVYSISKYTLFGKVFSEIKD
ncbi:MAG: DUF4013 domain-containing protein [Nanoarchaeota archaeon]|nr:DUF4013 domain-containing protein [Nanoarchaeota archaeon]MBU1269843.1 DUF4013 domain-containing protein [Nanoarchaeota archaeon]MBU1605151.1 DUF4013 domain-containing protein [Nanoarchaeota archaeon]MBU2442966.1 DUF4013 domain-containing protein [Nanoarchaeota archaeon]